jgi:hypothetical protein
MILVQGTLESEPGASAPGQAAVGQAATSVEMLSALDLEDPFSELEALAHDPSPAAAPAGPAPAPAVPDESPTFEVDLEDDSSRTAAPRPLVEAAASVPKAVAPTTPPLVQAPAVHPARPAARPAPPRPPAPPAAPPTPAPPILVQLEADALEPIEEVSPLEELALQAIPDDSALDLLAPMESSGESDPAALEQTGSQTLDIDLDLPPTLAMDPAPQVPKAQAGMAALLSRVGLDSDGKGEARKSGPVAPTSGARPAIRPTAAPAPVPVAKGSPTPSPGPAVPPGPSAALVGFPEAGAAARTLELTSALLRLLVRKGVITEGELQEELKRH